MVPVGTGGREGVSPRSVFVGNQCLRVEKGEKTKVTTVRPHLTIRSDMGGPKEGAERTGRLSGSCDDGKTRRTLSVKDRSMKDEFLKVTEGSRFLSFWSEEVR